MKNTMFQKKDGISPVLGAILMLAVGVTLLTTIQLSFVPVWNAQEELEHLKKMYDDFKELKSGVESSVQSGTVLSKPLIMGFKYSPKMFVYNPRESAYTSLDIQENTWAEIRYNEMLSEGMDDATSKKNISSSTMTYSLQGTKNYDPFVYEHGLIRRGRSNYTPSPQIVMANSTIYLLSLRPLGIETSTGVERRTVNIYPTSQQKNPVIGKNVWLILHTKPEYVDWWKSSIEKEGGNVKKKDNINGTVIAQMNSTVIKMGEAYLSTSPKAAPSHAPPYRLVKAVQDNINLPVDGIINLAVEVQDQYNNPVPNVQVNFNINYTRKPGNANSPTASILQNPAVSGADGRANVILKTGGAGFYYIDASMADSSSKTMFVYPASSQGGVLSLACAAPCTGTESEYTIRAMLKDSLGNLVNGSTIDFDKSDEGSILNPNSSTTVNGNSSTLLNITGARGIRITNIQVSNTTTSSSTISWDTINNITVTARSGYVFNSIVIPTKVKGAGCVRYGTSPGVYASPQCNNSSNVSSHSVNLSGLQSETAYYFIVNTSLQDGSGVNSTEYMFVTDKIRDDGVPPASVTDLNNATGALYIKWTWTDPADLDFDHVEIYIDGVPRGTVSRGMQSFNATYFQPGTSHAISTRAVDEFSRVSTWNNQSASTQSLFTYVFSFASVSGTVTQPDSARNSTDGLSAILTEEIVGGVNASDRPMNPVKNITDGIQSGTYNPGNLNATDGLIDITSLTQSTIKHATANPVMSLGTISSGSYSNTISSDNQYLALRETTSGTMNSQWNSWEPFTNASNSSLLEMNIGIEAYVADGDSAYIRLWDYPNNNWNATWHQLGISGLPTSDTDAVLWYNITNVAEIQRFVDATGNYRIMLADAKNAMGTADGSRSYFYIDEFKVGLKYFIGTLNVIYTFNETNSNATWQSINIRDSSYADSLAKVSIFNAAAGQWEPLPLRIAFTGGSTPAEHVNTIVGYGGNASDYDSGSGQIKIRFNWTGGSASSNLGVDLLNVTINYLSGGAFRLNITTNTTDIPETSNPNNHELQVRYNVSGDNFTLQIWNGATWSNKTALSNRSPDYYNITLLPSELQLYENTTDGTAGNINKYYVLVRYLDETADLVRSRLFLDYQRVYSW